MGATNLTIRSTQPDTKNELSIYLNSNTIGKKT